MYHHSIQIWIHQPVIPSTRHCHFINTKSLGYGQWTLWSICGATANGENVNCGPMKPAYPFDPARNFGSANVPQTFVDNSSYFYYTTRFMFAFFLIALALAVFSTFMGLLALCSRLGSAITAMFCCVILLVLLFCKFPPISAHNSNLILIDRVRL